MYSLQTTSCPRLTVNRSTLLPAEMTSVPTSVSSSLAENVTHSPTQSLPTWPASVELGIIIAFMTLYIAVFVIAPAIYWYENT